MYIKLKTVLKGWRIFMKFRRIISVLLAAVMIFGMVTNAFALPAAQQEDRWAELAARRIPVINVDGIGTSDIYQDKGTPDEKKIFYPEIDDVLNELKKLILPLFIFLINHDVDAFAGKLIERADAILGDIDCNPDGTSQDNISVYEYFYFPEDYNFDRELYFTYDWRLDPMDNSVRLKDYIEMIKAETGCEKVSLIPNSMGCTIVMAYIEQFGTDSVDSIVMRSSAFQGVSLVGELFNGRIQINKRAVLGYIRGFLGEDTKSKRVDTLLTVLDFTGVFDVLLCFVDCVLDRFKDRVYDELLIETFGYMPGVWSLVPDDYYEDAKAYMLDSEINAILIEKIDRYHYDVQCKADQLLQAAIDNGVILGIISNYGLYGCPVSANPDAQTDYLIDTVYTSGGATCAELGSTLGDDYEQAVNCGHNHISADRVIDASTCMFPEYTWFVKGMQHVKFNSDYRNLVYWILLQENQPDVFTNPQFVQFLALDKSSNTLYPLT